MASRGQGGLEKEALSSVEFIKTISKKKKKRRSRSRSSSPVRKKHKSENKERKEKKEKKRKKEKKKRSKEEKKPKEESVKVESDTAAPVMKKGEDGPVKGAMTREQWEKLQQQVNIIRGRAASEHLQLVGIFY